MISNSEVPFEAWRAAGGQLLQGLPHWARLSFAIFFQSPIALAVWGLMLITFISPLVRSCLASRASKAATK
ncbi:MAG: hypothetical protein LBU69_05815 [Deltaproteobacteria bacterium]|nr:hypothetical protein [Deltaproteobacteria bacterium]